MIYKISGILTKMLIVFLSTFLSVVHLHANSEAFNFPESLMYNGEPIDPTNILSIQFFSYLNQTTVIPKNLELHDDFDYQTSITFDAVTNTVTKKYKSNTRSACETYQYAGTYNNKHIILSTFHDTLGRYSASIDSIKRDGERIVRIDEIAGGEMVYGGRIELDSFENGILNYKSVTPYSGILSVIDKNTACYKALESLPSYPSSGGFWKLNRVEFLGPEGFKKETYGITFLDRKFYELWQESGYNEYDTEERKAEFCFCKIAISYIDGEKITLLKNELFDFAQEVTACIIAK